MFNFNYNTLFSLSILSIILFSSCKKDSSSDPVPTNSNVFFKEGYSPTSIGSSWVYTTEEGDYTMRVNGEIKVFNNSNYAVVEKLQDEDTTYNYMNLIGDTYSMYYSKNNLNSVFLNPTLPIGTTFLNRSTNTKYINNIALSEILEKGITRKVFETTYQNVIAIKTQTYYEYTASYIEYLKSSGYSQEQINKTISKTDIITVISYYALNVGLIEQYSIKNPSLNAKLKSYIIL